MRNHHCAVGRIKGCQLAQRLIISIYEFFKGETDMTSIDDSFARTWVMINDPNSPIDLTGLSSHQRACVLISRHDCPADLTDLNPYHRACVMVHRRDCHVDLTGLDSFDRAWVLENRPDYKPDNG